MIETRSRGATPAYRIEANQRENVLVVRYGGEVREHDIEQCRAALDAALVQFTPGFRLLVDLTGLQAMTPACADGLRQIMELCNADGVATVVRIIPDPSRDIGLQIMSYFHYGPKVHTMTCTSREEAEMILSA